VAKVGLIRVSIHLNDILRNRLSWASYYT